MTTYNRPVDATLHVHLDNGETWEATAEDMKKFGLVKRLDVYSLLDKKLREGLPLDDITDAEINPLRYLFEVVLMYPTHFDEFPDKMEELLASVREIERRLQADSARAEEAEDN